MPGVSNKYLFTQQVPVEYTKIELERVLGAYFVLNHALKPIQTWLFSAVDGT